MPQFYITAGAVPDDGGYYIDRRVDPNTLSPEDQYHSFEESDAGFALFKEMLREFVQQGDEIAICPSWYLTTK